MKKMMRATVMMFFVLLACSMTTKAAQKAPNDIKEFNGHYYYAYNVKESTTWDTCKAKCEAVGGHLVAINSAEENAFVYSLLPVSNPPLRAFIGLYNAGTRRSPNWSWVTGEPVEYTSWQKGEPSYMDGRIEEKYGQFFVESKKEEAKWHEKWNDGTGDTSSYYTVYKVYYICEWDSNPNAIQNVTADIENMIDDGDLSMSEFEPLQAKIVKCTKNSLTLTWKKNPYVDGYMIYGNKCGTKNRYEYIKTVPKSSSSTVMKGLKKATYYKYFVVSYKNQGEVQNIISVSKTVHATTQGGKYGNAKAVKLTKVGKWKSKLQKIAMKEGTSATIKGKSVKDKKPIRIHRGLAFESNDTYVAEVSNKGVIKAKHRGTCKIYVYAQNGVSKIIKLTVK